MTAPFLYRIVLLLRDRKHECKIRETSLYLKRPDGESKMLGDTGKPDFPACPGIKTGKDRMRCGSG